MTQVSTGSQIYLYWNGFYREVERLGEICIYSWILYNQCWL